MGVNGKRFGGRRMVGRIWKKVGRKFKAVAELRGGVAGRTPPPSVFLQGGPCWISKTIITHTAVNGPLGFKSKHPTFSSEDFNMQPKVKS